MCRIFSSFFILSGLAVLLYFSIDVQVAYWMQQHAAKLLPCCHLIYVVFNGAVVLPAVLLALVAATQLKILSQWKAWLLQLFFSLLLAQGVLAVVKILVGRARPYQVLSQGFQSFAPLHFNNAFFSFPSGHTLNIMLIAGFLGLRYEGHKYLLIFIGLVISFFRVIGLDHFVSDWMLTVYLSYLIFGISQFFIRRLPHFFYSTGKYHED